MLRPCAGELPLVCVFGGAPVDWWCQLVWGVLFGVLGRLACLFWVASRSVRSVRRSLDWFSPVWAWLVWWVVRPPSPLDGPLLGCLRVRLGVTLFVVGVSVAGLGLGVACVESVRRLGCGAWR